MGVNRNIPDLPKTDSVNDNALFEVFFGGKNYRVLMSVIKTWIQGIFDKITFNPQTEVQQPYTAFTFFYDLDENTWTFYNDISGISLQLGEELRARLVNDTGATLLDGKAVSVIGNVGLSLKVELLDASDFDSSIRGYGVMTHTVINGNPGYAVRYGAVRGIDTSLLTAGKIVYADPDNPGELTTTRPMAPNYPVRLGICLISNASDGILAIDTLSFNDSDTGVNIEGTLNGLVTQTPNVAFSVSGGVIYADVTNEAYPTKDLPVMLGGVRYLLNTTTNTGAGGAARIVIPPGNLPSVGDGGQKSWLYITLNTGVAELGISTAKPTVQNAGISTQVAYDAATTQSRGKLQAYRRENNASDSKAEGIVGSYGFTRVLADDSRSRGSAWDSGQDPTTTVNDLNILIALSAGVGKQLHYAALPAFDGLNYQIYNDTTNAITYQLETNLINIVTDANGGTLLGNGFYYTLRVYYKLNSNGIGNDVIVTRPQGHYNSGAGAEADALKYTTLLADTGIEDIVYPLYDLVIAKTGGGGANTSLFSITSLRSKTPGVGGGSGGEGVATDDKIRISAADNINDYLNPKIAAGTGITKTILNPGANEQLEFKLTVLNKYDATTAPTASNDNTEGYEVGSEWIDITNDNSYTCVDATTSAAVWLIKLKGPSSSTDNAIARYHETTGEILQNSKVIVDDNGDIFMGSNTALNEQNVTFWMYAGQREINIGTVKYVGRASHTDGTTWGRGGYKITTPTNGDGVLTFFTSKTNVEIDAFTIDEDGNLLILITPTTDSGSNDLLSINSSTGAIEKTARISVGNDNEIPIVNSTGDNFEYSQYFKYLAASRRVVVDLGLIYGLESRNDYVDANISHQIKTYLDNELIHTIVGGTTRYIYMNGFIFIKQTSQATGLPGADSGFIYIDSADNLPKYKNGDDNKIHSLTTPYFTGSLTDGAPTNAEINAIISNPSGAGYEAIIKDTDGTGSMYKVIYDGSGWHYTEFTASV
jgi:hypothetical protein